MNIVYKNLTLFLLVSMILALCLINPALAKTAIEISNQESAQFEISSSSSPKIYIDVIDSSYIQAPIGDDDILLITHSHPDHYDKGFCDSFPGKSLIFKEGVLVFKNGKAISIPSTHTDKLEDKFMPEGGSNYILIVEVNGLKIAHFGDIGQSKFTEEQIRTIGRVDRAITQFVNPLSDMNLQNMKAYNLMDSISPSIIIPTAHGRFQSEVIKQAQKKWDVFASEEKILSFSKETLPTKTAFIVWGDGASFIKEDFSLSEWSANIR